MNEYSQSADNSAIQTDAPGANRRATTIKIDIVSDAICPWCFVGKRNLELAAAQLPDTIKLDVHWHPFQLNPDMPKDGVERSTYRIRKFGSWARSLELDAQVAAAAQQAGLTMRHDLMQRTPNTFSAHRLVWLAGKEGVQGSVVERLFKSYFIEGMDIGDRDVLTTIGTAADIPADQVRLFLASTEGADEVAAAELTSRKLGISGVPTVFINGNFAFSGAQRPALILAHLRQASSLS